MAGKSGLAKVQQDMAVVKTKIGSIEKTQEHQGTKLDGIQTTLDTVLTTQTEKIRQIEKERLPSLEKKVSMIDWKFLGLAVAIILCFITIAARLVFD